MVYKEKDCIERYISPDGVTFYTVFFFSETYLVLLP